jgi:hypothetical protein
MPFAIAIRKAVRPFPAPITVKPGSVPMLPPGKWQTVQPYLPARETKVPGQGYLPDLSNPRKPTSSMPVERFTNDIAARHAYLYPRAGSRGDLQPVGGIRQTLAGEPGGVSRGMIPAFRAFVKTSPIRGSVGQGGRLNAAVRKVAAAARLAEKPKVRIVPGLSGLDVAQAPRWIPSRLGAIPRGQRADVPNGSLLRGILAQHRTMPRSSRFRLIAERLQNPGVAAAASRQAELPGEVIDSATIDHVRRIGAPAPLVLDGTSANSAQTTAPVSDNGMERLAFLAAVVFIGWLALRRG